MKKAISRGFLAIALMSAVGLAIASPGNNGGGNGGCGQGQQTNGCGTSGGQGGAGGAGGQGGNGYGIGVGIGQGGNAHAEGGKGGAGGSVIGSGNSANNLSSKQKQGQAQGQLQGQQQSARSNSRSNSDANNEGNHQNVTVQGDNYEAPRIPVATAYAAPLTASNGTCMGSSSVGGQFVMAGLSIGTTWTDDSCDMRYDAEALRQAGMQQAAVARLCQKAEIAAAMDAAGTPCAKAKPVVVASTTQHQRTPTAEEKTARYTGTDPIVRKRLGLPPL